MDALTAITAAMKRAGIIDPDETPSNAIAEYNRGRLNDLLDFWSLNRLAVLVRTENSKVLTAGDGEYSIGESAADISTVRPIRIEQAFLRDSANLDQFLDCVNLTQEERNKIPYKTTQGTPGKLYYYPSVPNGTIYFDWVPSTAWTLYLYSWKPFTAFADLTTDYNFAPGYAAAIKANLAVKLANDYQVRISAETKAEMRAEAKETLSAIKAVNVEVPHIKSCGSAPGQRNSFNFDRGY